ncbi:MAG: RNase adapter RapZ [Deltaproteobacteria bacterium]|nr:MAG: RNase adapter RapZ [Deltaproteobacteria bacterium]
MTGRRVVVITGLSGSGKSCAAKALEDAGFFVIDNLPLPLLPQCLGLTALRDSSGPGIAVVIDVRSRKFLDELDRTLAAIRQAGYQIDILFLDSADDVIVRRFSETRRRHPLAGEGLVQEGIARERDILLKLQKQANLTIDSSWLTPHQLRDQVVKTVCGEKAAPLAVLLQSFGFRYGVPTDSNLVLDVRFLPNPHFVPDLKDGTGLDEGVAAFALDNPLGQGFLDRTVELLAFLLPEYQREGKSYLTVSVGCTGGRHRSVAVVERLRELLDGSGVKLDVAHRDVKRK